MPYVRIGFVFSLCAGVFFSCFVSLRAVQARGRWTELNIGPFYVATDGDVNAARDTLTQLEQVRWVLGGLLESKDLPSLWPIRVLLTSSEKTNPTPPAGQFISKRFVWNHSAYILVLSPGARLPLDEVAGLLLDSNTPRLPPEVESGLRQLFATLQAKGSRVTWGGAPAHPDLAWARLQLFATKFEYTLSFHIFLAALKGGIGLTPAERNAFGKDPHLLEQEAAANLASAHWQPTSVSGRPLDPKRDFGEHALDDPTASVYLADYESAADPKAAEPAYKAAIKTGGSAAGGSARALGYEGLAQIARLEKENPKPFLDDAIRAGSGSAPVYVDASDGLDPAQALPLLKRAAQLNPLWARPIFEQAQIAANPKDKQALLKKAVQLNPRDTAVWIELAQLQTVQGEATAAQGSWLRAEDSAPTEAERDRVHQLRVDSEQQRLDAADHVRRRDRDAVHLADEQAQQNEAGRIRAAEQKANQALDKASGGAKPENVVPWDQVVPKKKLQGSLLRVECLGSDARLTVRDRTGASLQLLLQHVSDTGLICGLQATPRRVSLTYAAQPDDRFHTAGNVVDIEIH